jgi:hypothetical protein
LDLFTFSLIPAFFGSFWCRAIEAIFGEFLGIILRTQFEIGRVIFVIPEFGFFIGKVVAEMDVKGGELAPEGAEAFARDFVDRWQRDRDFWPSTVAAVLGSVERKSDFLRDAFLRPAMFNGRLYRICPASCSWAPSLASRVFGLLERDIDRLTVMSDIPAALSSFSDVLLVRPDIDRRLVMSSDDLRELSDLLSFLNSPVEDLRPVQFPPTLHPDKRYHTVELVLPKADDVVASDHADEDIETKLRRLLVELSLIPSASHGDRDIIQLLHEQVLISREDHKARLSLEVQELERSLSLSHKGRTSEDLLVTLESEFASRSAQRKSDYERVTFSRSCVERLRFPVINYLGEMLWPATLPLQAAIFETFMKTETAPPGAEFMARFETLAGRFTSWASQAGWRFLLDAVLFHDFVITDFPIDGFARQHPGLVECDVLLAKSRSDVFERAKATFLETLTRGGRTPAWAHMLVTNRRIFEPIVQAARDAFAAPAPGSAMRLFDDLFKKKCQKALAIAGIGQTALDEMMPVFQFVLEVARPNDVLVRIAYMLEMWGRVEQQCGTTVKLFWVPNGGFNWACTQLQGFVQLVMGELGSHKGKVLFDFARWNAA